MSNPLHRPGRHEFVVVANRLPVERRTDDRGREAWTTAPGGLVTALEPIMQRTDGAWVGWTGVSDEQVAPFDAGTIHVQPVNLSADEVRDYYEGCSNATIWPLYHDVIVAPEYHRHWWRAYQAVNERFAAATAAISDRGATVWVHDYQLQLVPALLRARRPDLRIGFFAHIPFPPVQLFAQLPWRSQVLRGLLGADLVGFQRAADARAFLQSCRETLGLVARGGRVAVTDADGTNRPVQVREFPISIDAAGVAELAASPAVRARATEIRQRLGGRTVALGVDRLDYTKGIRHRLQVWEELLDEGRVDPSQVVLVQVAMPTRERVEEYRRLRDEIELIVGRINGQHASIGQPSVVYLHHGYDRAETTALFRAADVMLVTPLRDGMNLVAKEYVASRVDGDGVLVLSEFTGAAVELRQSVIVNPHDIAGSKDAVHYALTMPVTQVRSRMRRLRRQVLGHDVRRWADEFLGHLNAATAGRPVPAEPQGSGRASGQVAAEPDPSAGQP